MKILFRIFRGLAVAGIALTLPFSPACRKEDRKVVAIVPKGQSHLFWQSVHAGAVKAARENNIELVWNGPSTETDFNAQLQIVDAMINRHVDAIALAPIDKTVMVSVVERAAREKIPVVIFDSSVDTDKFASQVATDNYQAGTLAAARMGVVTGGKGKIVIVAVQAGSSSTMLREQGFEDAIHKDFPGVQIVDKRYGEADVAKSLRVAENMLTANPDLVGVFASNESSTVGAAQALRARKSSIKLVGFDAGPTLEADLRSGVIDSLVVQNPFKMGYEAILAAVTVFKGGTPQKINNLPPRLVLKEDLDKPEVQAQLHPDLKQYLN